MTQTRAYRGDYIKGNFIKPVEPSGEVFSQNPGDLDETPLRFPFAFSHINDAVYSGTEAFKSWRQMAASDRYAAIGRYREELGKRTEVLAQQLSFEGGKPLWESHQEVAHTLAAMDYYLGQPSLVQSEKSVALAQSQQTGTYRYHPYGVVTVIAPSTLPLYHAHTQLIPALLMGNTAVMKSSKFNPMTGQLMAEIVDAAGIPAGVLNVVHGDAEFSKRLVKHKDIQGVFFTGSHEKALRLRKELVSDYWKILVVQSGGKNATILWEDCDYDKALKETLYSAFITTGQRFSSTRRVLVHEKHAERFIDDFHQLAKRCRIGYGLVDNRSPFMGPLLSEAKMQNYLRYQGIATREGHEEIMRGKALEKDKRGYYVSPSLHLAKKPDPKSIYQKDEFFGPNLAIFPVKALDETAQIVNQTNDGLVTSLYSQDKKHYHYLVDTVVGGLLHWNCPTVTPCHELPLGGIRQSGNGRPMGSLAFGQCSYPVSSLESTKPSEDVEIADKFMPSVEK